MKITPRDAKNLRDALDERSRATGKEARRIVVRVTRTADARADELLAAIGSGQTDGLAERLTAPGETPGKLHRYFAYGVSGYGGDDGYGA